MQSTSNCEYYTPNKNPNKTCKNKTRCLLWSDEHTCYDYKEKEKISNNYGEY